MNPRCIVTTNYDNLLENAFNNKGIFLDVIEKEEDLPYAHTNQMIIKMHGGFKYNNFVLKEDDYLNYSTNFTLIENYIKALFARYTVLFVGYSFSDPDTKQIFNWVRTILKEDQQRAYIINPTDKYSTQLSDYYKNMGINVIFADRYSDIPTKATERTTWILDRIIQPRFTGLAKINEVFKRYSIFNYVPAEYISDLISKYYLCYYENNRLIFNQKNISDYALMTEYFESEKLQKKYPSIIETLRKSSINAVVFDDGRSLTNKNRKEFEISNTLPDVSIFENFDFSSVRQVISSVSNVSPLHIAYCHYYLNDDLKCYEILECEAKKQLLSGDFDRYILTTNNKIRIGKRLKNHAVIPTDTILKIINEIDNDEQQGVYADYFHIANDNQMLLDLVDFRVVYRRMNGVIDLCRKADGESRKTYTMFVGERGHERLEEYVVDFYKCIQYNFILLEFYTEILNIFALFIDSIMLSHSMYKEEIPKDETGQANVIVALKELSRFDVMIILRYISSDELTNVIKKHKISKLRFSDEAISYIKTVLANLNSCFQTITRTRRFLMTYRKIFILLNNIEMDQELCDLILNAVHMIVRNPDALFECDELVIFISNHFMNKRHIFSEEDLSRLIVELCYTITQNSNVGADLLKNLIFIFRDVSIDKVIEFKIQDASLFYAALPLELLTFIHIISTIDFQKQITEKVNKHLEEDKRDIKVYYYALINDVISPNPSAEDSLYKEGQTKRKNVESVYYPNLAISYSASLYFEDKLLDKERFVSVIKRDKSLALLVDPSNYDYESLNPDALLYLTNSALDKISKNEIAHKEIAKKLKAYLMEDWNDRIAKIYVKYFS